MDPVIVGIAGIVIMLALIFLKVPLYVSMSVPAIIGNVIILGTEPALGMMVQRVTSYVSSYTLSCVPPFILMGYLSLTGGLSDELFDFAYKWVGRVPGGLAVAGIIACTLFGAITGSGIAGTLAIGAVALPQMTKRNYDVGLATGSMASGGTLGYLIPPSIAAVIYAVVVNVSVGKQLVAGLVPGLITMLIFVIMIMTRCWLNPKLGPKAVGISWQESMRSSWKILPTAVVFLLMLGGMFAGLFTPTEAGAVGVAGVLLVSLVRKKMTWKGLKEGMFQTAMVSGQVFAILIGAALLSQFFALSRIGEALIQSISGLELPGAWMLAFILFLYLPLGMVMDQISMILVTMPIVFPVVQLYGYDAIWFGVIMIKLACIAMITPPVAINLYTVQIVAKDVPFAIIMRGTMWFLIAEVVTLAILIAFPQLSLWIPNIMIK